MDIDILTKLVDDGLSQRKIAAELNTSHVNVQYWLKKFGLTTNPKRKYRPSRNVNRRQEIKRILVSEAGGKCLDCGFVGPPFMYDFDHRDPGEKAFKVSGQATIAIDRLRAEVKKCDLVCSNCHRWRTHKQRCGGCLYCQ